MILSRGKFRARTTVIKTSLTHSKTSFDFHSMPLIGKYDSIVSQ